MINGQTLESFYAGGGYLTPEMTTAFLQANPGFGGVPVPVLPSLDIDAWVGGSPQLQGGILAPGGGAIFAAALAILRSLISKYGARQLMVWVLSLVGIELVKEVVQSSGQGAIEGGLATIIPGLQPWLGEFPEGLGSIEGRIVRRWTAGGARVFFATFEQPTRQGSHLQHYVYSPKRGAWLPYSLRRNIVFGAKELDVAAALSGKKRISKKRALRALAGRTPRTRAKKED